MPVDLKAMTRESVVFFDCGTGTTLQARGLAAGERPEVWNITRPEDLVCFHRECLEAGAQLLKLNTFGANALHFPPGGAYALGDLIAAAVHNARKAIRLAGREGSAWTAFSMGPTGRLLAPFGDLAFEDAVTVFREAAAHAAEAGADMILIETMGDTLEAKAAALGAKEGAPGLPFAVTMTFEENGRLLTGGTPGAALAIMEALGAAAFGVNCGAGPARALGVLPEIANRASVPVIVNPNAGLPRVEGGRTFFDMTPEDFAIQCEELYALGASLLGGCCGTTSAHIAALTARLRGKTPVLSPKERTPAVCSSRKLVSLGGEEPEIGVLDAKTAAEAFRTGEWDDLCDEAVDLDCDGAEILLLPIPASAVSAAQAVEQLQCVTQTPLGFIYCGGDTAALEAALRHCNGVPLLRCTNENDRQAMEVLAAKYGAVCV